MIGLEYVITLPLKCNGRILQLGLLCNFKNMNWNDFPLIIAKRFVSFKTTILQFQTILKKKMVLSYIKPNINKIIVYIISRKSQKFCNCSLRENKNISVIEICCLSYFSPNLCFPAKPARKYIFSRAK